MKSDSYTLELINQLKSEGCNSSEVVKSICYELIEYSMRHKDCKGQTYALYYLGELRFHQYKYKQGLDYLLKGMELFQTYKDDDQLIDYCILLGILFTKLGNEQRAFENFCTGMEIAKKNQDYLRQGSLYCCIASAYAKLNSYDEALNYYYREKQCYQYLLNDDSINNQYFGLWLKLYLHIGSTLCSLEKYKQAYSILKEVEQYDICSYEEFQLSYYALKSKIFYGLKLFPESLYYIKLFIERAMFMPNILDNFDDCYEILFKLLSLNEIVVAESLLDLLHKSAFVIGTDEYKLKYYEALLQFKLHNGSKEEFIKSFECYLNFEERQEKEFREMKLINFRDKRMIDSTAKLKRIMMNNMSLMKEKSEKDELTKLANRYYLNEYSEEKFQEARKHKVTIGIDVIDIDFFKQYNDWFGHLNGDHCLIQVAEAMREAAGEHFLARFGGDEFFIIFYDTNTEEILETAKRLKDILQEKKITQAQEVPYDCITISQGIINEIPKGGQTMSDFIHSADLALYKGKKSEKNSIYVGIVD